MKARSWRLGIALVGPALVLFAPFLFQGRILSSQDIARVYTPIATLLREVLRSGDPSRLIWNPDLGAGFPLIADGATTPFYLPHWLLLTALPPGQALTAALLLAYFGSAAAMAAFARSLGLSAAARFVAGMGYAWSGFAVGHCVHVNVVAGLPFLPLVLLGIERAATSKAPTRPAILAGLAWGLQCLGGHPQVALVTAATAVAFAAWRFWPRGGDSPEPRTTAGLRVLGILLSVGAGTAAIYYLPMAELASQSVAPGSGLAQPPGTTYSLPLPHLATAIAPFLFYDANGEYHGAWNPAEMSLYPGLVALWLAGIALTTRRAAREVWFFAGLAGVGILFAVGSASPAFGLLQWLPLFRDLRAPARYVLVTDLCLSLLAAFGLDALPGLTPAKRRGAVIAAVILAALALGVSSMGPTAFGPLAGDRWQDAQPGVLSALWPLHRWWPALALGLAAGALAMSARRPNLALVGIAVAVMFDLVVFAATALSPQWVEGRPAVGAAAEAQPARGSGRVYMVGSPEPWRGASNRALTDGYPGLDLYVSLPLRRHSDYMQAFWLSDQAAPGLLQAAAVATVVDGWRQALDPRTRIEDEEFSPRWPIATLASGESVRFDLGGVPADSLRLVTALTDAPAPPKGTVVATVRLSAEDRPEVRFDLRAGIETADRRPPDATNASASLPSSVAGWSRVDGASEGRFYLARLGWPEVRALTAVTLEFRGAGGRLLLFGGSLRTAATSRALTPFMAAPYTRRSEGAGQVLYDLAGARPRATAVHQVVRVNDARAAIRRLAEGSAPTLGAIGLEDAQAPDPAGTGPSRVALVSDAPMKIELLAEMDGSGYVVLADAHYPGWTATVDGAAVPIHAADGLFRAVFVPGGAHHVVFSYHPRALWLGVALSVSTLAAAALVLWRTRTSSPRYS